MMIWIGDEGGFFLRWWIAWDSTSLLLTRIGKRGTELGRFKHFGLWCHRIVLQSEKQNNTSQLKSTLYFWILPLLGSHASSIPIPLIGCLFWYTRVNISLMRRHGMLVNLLVCMIWRSGMYKESRWSGLISRVSSTFKHTYLTYFFTYTNPLFNS